MWFIILSLKFSQLAECPAECLADLSADEEFLKRFDSSLQDPLPHGEGNQHWSSFSGRTYDNAIGDPHCPTECRSPVALSQVCALTHGAACS